MNFKEKYSKRDDFNKKSKKEKSINKANIYLYITHILLYEFKNIMLFVNVFSS